MEIVPDLTRPAQLPRATPHAGDETTLFMIHERPHLMDLGRTFRAP